MYIYSIKQSEEQIMLYRVHLSSRPGMWEHYGGYVDVVVDKIEDVTGAAIKKLHRTFPERPDNSWNVNKITVRGL